jgi:hypothetical protein
VFISTIYFICVTEIVFSKKSTGSILFYKKRWELQDAGFNIKIALHARTFLIVNFVPALLDKNNKRKENLVSGYTHANNFF